MDSNLIQIFGFGLATFLVGFVLTPKYIQLLQYAKMGKQIRENATIGKAFEFFKLHSAKAGTPTMGGAIILGSVFFMVLLSIILQKYGFTNNSLLNQKETYLSLFTLAAVGLLGGVDDWMNIKGIGKTKGLSAKFKMAWLIIFSGLGAWWFYDKLGWSEILLSLPMLGGIEIGILFIPLFMFIIIAAANSVNFTDGLDGLAGGLLLFTYGVYGFITYDQGLFLLSTLCVSICGALVAFLWFNIKPAKFFMGDVGSLALGANLGLMALLTNTVAILVIVGMIFILETLSVIIQLTSKRLRKGKKVFKIAPFHHHLEACGWSEETVVFRLWLVGMILSVVGVIFYMITK
ncbi:phospho-N-acetylmuramoyl-pentapeptide-transferase [Candidatus Gracilibacteria bacterium]|nr:phospho-N-acetylmuramoyl-pentapeptide-transferase [Candidatus Gracilibacteria bacterium]